MTDSTDCTSPHGVKLITWQFLVVLLLKGNDFITKYGKKYKLEAKKKKNNSTFVRFK